MKIIFADLWHPDGTIDRGPYALIGGLGIALKHNLDRVVATGFFHRPWSPFSYWVPVRDVARITEIHGEEARFLATMVALALPFIWIGVTLTTKRLRSAGLSPRLVWLFFVPLVNLLFFLILCLLPGHGESKAEGRIAPLSKFARFLPESALGSAAFSLLITVPIGLGLVVLATRVLANYGWGLFVAVPFVMGFVATLIHGQRRSRSLKASLSVACLSVILLGAALLAVAVEGVVCLIMAAPIALLLAVFGGLCAHQLQRMSGFRNDAPIVVSALLIFVPGLQLLEHVAARPSPIFVVRSTVEIQAAPQEVWSRVITFSQIPAPKEWIFRTGIAYPIRAEIVGRGTGAERHCVFSTGAFVEPIEVWDEPNRLKFSVTSNPPPMEEWTPYSHIEPPHLHGFLISEGGQFLLTPLPNGGTRLEGTTWYRHGLWPSAYWRLWSDAIIHRIHMRVLTHIRDEAEKAKRQTPIQ